VLVDHFGPSRRLTWLRFGLVAAGFLRRGRGRSRFLSAASSAAEMSTGRAPCVVLRSPDLWTRNAHERSTPICFAACAIGTRPAGPVRISMEIVSFGPLLRFTEL
jgi:hypothetical protein